VHEIPATADLRERIGRFFGPEVRDALYEVRAERGPARLTGFVAKPECNRGNAKLQYLFLNGRWIRDRSLGYAIQESYRGLLMTGRYAVAFLFLELPPDLVDVNVHPTKAEVRFRDAQSMWHLVHSAIRSRLNAENLVPLLNSEFGIRNSEFIPETAKAAENAIDFPKATSPQYSAATFEPLPAVIEPTPPNNHSASQLQEPDSRDSAFRAPLADSEFQIPNSELSALNSLQLGRSVQVHDSYIVLETAEGMLVIDQHALHERILFEQLKSRLKEGKLEKQRLLVPEPVDLTAEQAARVLEAKAQLAELGLEVEDFGNGTVLLSSYPALLGKRAPGTILREVVDFLSAQDRTPNREQLLNDLMSMMACKAAVKAGHRLTSEQIAALLEQRHLVNDTHHCPHGRPTSLLFSRKELDRQFGRT
jgi:DNA mismatch repair protein MutL